MRQNKHCVFWVAFIAVILILGCTAPTPKKPRSADGKHRVDCSGQMETWAGCAEKAIEICGVNRYDVIWRSTRREPFRKMTIMCRDRKRLIDPKDAERGL